jgi:hypothetical protein
VHVKHNIDSVKINLVWINKVWIGRNRRILPVAALLQWDTDSTDFLESVKGDAIPSMM